jgi:F-type H+-transporting ATPase subunit epsilon
MITLELVTLTGVKFAEEVYEVLLPTPDGQIAVFPDHMPVVTLASEGVISVRRNQNNTDDQLEHYATNGGIVEITHNRVRVLVDEADTSDEISEQEAQEALERARAQAASATDKVSLEKAESVIRTQENRIRVANFKNLRKRK